MSTADARTSRAIRVTWVGFAGNVILTLLKFTAAILGNSTAMLADAVHSLSDFVTDIVVVVGFVFVGRPADESHDYGHGKVETLCTAIIGIMLLVVAAGILKAGITSIWQISHGANLPAPGFIALAAALISILVKELLFRYTRRAGEQLNSEALIANAWHHRSDMLSSLATSLGIGGAILLGPRWRLLDPLAACLVSGFIVYVAVQISSRAMHDLLEGSLNEQVEGEILAIINNTAGAREPHNLRTRRVGSNIAIDVHIRVHNSLTISQAHDIATTVEQSLREAYGMGTFVSVHVEPADS